MAVKDLEAASPPPARARTPLGLGDLLGVDQVEALLVHLLDDERRRLHIAAHVVVARPPASPPSAPWRKFCASGVERDTAGGEGGGGWAGGGGAKGGRGAHCRGRGWKSTRRRGRAFRSSKMVRTEGSAAGRGAAEVRTGDDAHKNSAEPGHGHVRARRVSAVPDNEMRERVAGASSARQVGPLCSVRLRQAPMSAQGDFTSLPS